jgi:hypothetical protein
VDKGSYPRRDDGVIRQFVEAPKDFGNILVTMWHSGLALVTLAAGWVAWRSLS